MTKQSALKKVLVFQKHYLPGFKAGGPVSSLQGIVQQLGDDFAFYFVALNRDMGETERYSNIERDKWNDVEKAKVLYVESTFDKAISNLVFSQEWDLVYVQSFFSPLFSLLPLYWWRRGKLKAARFLLAPRGQFSKGALSIKPRKKKLFRFVMSKIGFFKDVFWHLSSEFEKEDLIREVGFRVDSDKVFVARNLAPLGTGSKIDAHLCNGKDKLKLVFLSRISPMKNLEFALDLLKAINDISIEFNIYGPVDNERRYWDMCQKKFDTLPSNITVNYRGSVEPREALAVFADHDLFFFPTLGENFGHVIFESLLAGCPVLCSDQTPWNDLSQFRVGNTFELSQPSKFVSAIQDLHDMDAVERIEQRKRCREYATSLFVRDGTVKANHDMFKALTQ